MPWWERFRGRLEYEQKCLDEWGVRWELDLEAFADKKVLIRLWTEMDGKEVMLTCCFPDTYPYTRVEVMTDDLTLEHHQNPFEKNLCLLGQSTGNWEPDDTLAGILKTQLDKVVSTGNSNNKATAIGLEENQGEPISAYYTYLRDTSILIDGAWEIDSSVKSGKLIIGFLKRSEFSWLGAVLEIQDENGRTLETLDQRLSRLFPKRITVRWIRSDRPIVENDPEKFRGLLSQMEPSLAKEGFLPVNKDEALDIIGIIQPEELSYRQSSDGWLFFVHHRIKDRNAITYKVPYLVRADRAGLNDLSSRIPELESLRVKKVALVGLGCVGAPSALHLARAGVGELRIIDGDEIEAGPTIRWPLGLSVVGGSKAETIADFIDRSYPYTRVVAFHHRIGSALKQPSRDNEVLAELLDGVDLLFDASAEIGIQFLLSDLAREKGIPYICISTTHGGWGGIVARVWPGADRGCWACLQYWLTDGSIQSPPQDESEFFQPAGCGSPTFRGAGFDVEEISLHGARMAASTLSNGIQGGYPQSCWDVAVVSLRDEGGSLVNPLVRTYPLDRNGSCKNHGD